MSAFGIASPLSTSAASAAEVRPITLPVPLDSLDEVYWSDTWGACRGSGCSRSHLGVDMMGPKMTPLLAAADGVVSWMRYDNSRGNNINITDDEGWTYHYVHLNNDNIGTDDGAAPFELAFAPGIERGARVEAGQLIGYLGDSGNAEWTGAHLHFEIERPDGVHINPTPSVDAARAGAVNPPDLDEDERDFAADVYRILVGADASTTEAAELADVVATEGLAAALEPFVSPDSRAASIDRLYYAVFNRLPDDGGFDYWIGRRGTDLDLASISNHFADSDEFTTRFAGKDFEALLDQIYLEMFNRPPDEPGKAYWLERLEDPDDPVTKGTVMSFFTESDEARRAAGTRSEIVALTAFFSDGAMPNAAEVSEWQSLRSTTSFVDAVDSWFLSDAATIERFAGLLD